MESLKDLGSKLVRTALGAALLAFAAGAANATSIGEAEPNDTHLTANSIDGFFSLGANPNIGNSTTIPWVSISGSVDPQQTDRDFFSFTVDVSSGPITGVFDVDTGVDDLEKDSELFLYDAAGNVLATNDDFLTLDPGTVSGLDSLISFVFTASGTYFIQIEERNANFEAPGWQYQLQVSLPQTLPVPEPATLAVFGFGLGCLGLARRRMTARRV